MVALIICASSYNVNIKLSPSFALSINSILVFTSRVCTCAHYTFFWPISTAALAFVTNFTSFHANQSRSGTQYFSTFLMAFPNRGPLAVSRFALISLLTVITIADSRLLPLSSYSLRHFLLMSQHNIVFNRILVKDSTFLLNSSNFSRLRYLSNYIP